jgi:hypothetical protein
VDRVFLTASTYASFLISHFGIIASNACVFFKESFAPHLTGSKPPPSNSWPARPLLTYDFGIIGVSLVAGGAASAARRW